MTKQEPIHTVSSQSTTETHKIADSKRHRTPLTEEIRASRDLTWAHITGTSEFRHRMSIVVAIACSWIARSLPATVRFWIADRIGDILFRALSTYRQNVLANQRVVAESDSVVDETLLVQRTRNVFRTASRNFADLLVVPHKTRTQFLREAEIVGGGWHNLDKALANGQGAIILTGHVGSFDYAGQVVCSKGYDLTSVTAKTTARFVFDGVTHLRRAHGHEVIEATPAGVRRVVQQLREGRCVVFGTDRDFFQNGRPVTFFGQKTTLPPGAVRIARQTGAPIVPIFAERIPGGIGLRIEPSFFVPKTSDIDNDLDQGMTRVVARLEAAIGRRIEQWVMFQRVWPTEPPDPVRAVPIGSPLESDIVERVQAAISSRRPIGRDSATEAESPTDHIP